MGFQGDAVVLQNGTGLATQIPGQRGDHGDQTDGIGEKAAGLLVIELLVPGGTLIVLTLLLTGTSIPIPEKVAAALPILNMLKRS